MVSCSSARSLGNSLRLNFGHPNAKQHTHRYSCKYVGIFTAYYICSSRDEKDE